MAFACPRSSSEIVKSLPPRAVDCITPLETFVDFPFAIIILVPLMGHHVISLEDILVPIKVPNVSNIHLIKTRDVTRTMCQGQVPDDISFCMRINKRLRRTLILRPSAISCY